jgi:hypothetical protein
MEKVEKGRQKQNDITNRENLASLLVDVKMFLAH